MTRFGLHDRDNGVRAATIGVRTSIGIGLAMLSLTVYGVRMYGIELLERTQ
jgi:hypothetical protein